MSVVVPSCTDKRSSRQLPAVLRQCALVGLVLASAAAFCLGQIPEQKNTAPVPTTPTPAPSVPGVKTAEEAADAVKAPVVASPKETTAAPVDPKTYVIGPEDILRINIWREQEVSGQVQVRPDGKIGLQLLGEMDAAGLTPNELGQKVTEVATQFINNPNVSVQVVAVLSRKFFITGAVSRPGRYSLVVPTRILEALINAGSFREFASTKKITIMRNGKLIKFNYNDVIKGKNMDQNIFVESGDYINVPE